MRAIPLLSVALVVGSSLPAMAANCKSSGGLLYLGNTRDGSRSVWLSRTDLGSFALEAAQGNQTVDTWAVPPQRRLHLSASPVVSNGNGGTHRLFETSGNQPCLIDTHNQKRDWHFPPLPPRPDPHPRPDPGPAPVPIDFGPRPDVGPAPIPPDFGPRPDVGPAPIPPDFGPRPDPGPAPIPPGPGPRPDPGPAPIPPGPTPGPVQHRSRSRCGSRMAPWCGQLPEWRPDASIRVPPRPTPRQGGRSARTKCLPKPWRRAKYP